MSKKNDTWMPLYIGDYLADTSRLSTEQHGAYLLILMDYWRNGPPLDDDEELSSITKLALPQWRKHAAKIRGLFRSEGGRLIQKRADEERQKAGLVSSKRSEAGKQGAAARWGKTDGRANGEAIANGMASAMANGMANASQNDAPSQSQSEIQKTKGAQTTATTVARPPPEVDPPEANGQQPTLAGTVCRAMRRAGLADVNPGDPRLLALLAQGITEAEFVAVATEAAAKRKGWPWVLKVVQGRRQDAAAIAAAPAPAAPVVSPTAWADSRDGVVNRACQLGLDAYDPTAAHYGTGPTWAQYRTAVIAADQAATGAAA